MESGADNRFTYFIQNAAYNPYLTTEEVKGCVEIARVATNKQQANIMITNMMVVPMFQSPGGFYFLVVPPSALTAGHFGPQTQHAAKSLPQKTPAPRPVKIPAAIFSLL